MYSRLKLSYKGIRDNILKSQDVLDYLSDFARQKARECGDGYGIEQYVGKRRVNVAVYPATDQAAKDNMENKTLLKVIGV